MSAGPSILVVGGAGYIGSHCCKTLAQAGYSPVCFDNFSTGHRSFVKWGPAVEGDVRDQTLLAHTLKEYAAVAVLHFAAASLVGESVANPEKYYRINVEGTLSLLRAMLEAGCVKLVFSSTGAVYGQARNGVISESDMTRPVNPYGRTKLTIEDMLEDFRAAYGLASFSLRYFNASGADPAGEIGESHDPETHLIPRALMAVQGLVGDFAIFGTDYETPDGTAIRDYIHVADLADAHILALRQLINGANGARLNLGTGQGYSVRAILDRIALETGAEVPCRVKSRRSGDPPVLVADPAKARSVLGFRPCCSDLSTIIRSAWNWQQRAAKRAAVDEAIACSPAASPAAPTAAAGADRRVPRRRGTRVSPLTGAPGTVPGSVPAAEAGQG